MRFSIPLATASAFSLGGYQPVFSVHEQDAEVLEGESEDAQELKRLSELAGGWIMFSWDSPENAFEDTVFVPMAEWLEEYEKHFPASTQQGES